MLATIFNILSVLCVFGAAVFVAIAHKTNNAKSVEKHTEKSTEPDLMHLNELSNQLPKHLPKEEYILKLIAHPKSEKRADARNALVFAEYPTRALYGSLDEGLVFVRLAMRKDLFQGNERASVGNSVDFSKWTEKLGKPNFRFGHGSYGKQYVH